MTETKKSRGRPPSLPWQKLEPLLVHLIRHGWSLDEMGTLFGVTPRGVKKQLDKLGLATLPTMVKRFNRIKAKLPKKDREFWSAMLKWQSGQAQTHRDMGGMTVDTRIMRRALGVEEPIRYDDE